MSKQLVMCNMLVTLEIDTSRLQPHYDMAGTITGFVEVGTEKIISPIICFEKGETQLLVNDEQMELKAGIIVVNYDDIEINNAEPVTF